MTLKHEVLFSIDYFLHVIETSCWQEFVNEFFIKREGVDVYESRHPLSLMSWYSPEFFEGLDFNPKLEAEVDF